MVQSKSPILGKTESRIKQNKSDTERQIACFLSSSGST